MESKRPVVIKRIPERLTSRQARTFWQEVQPIVTSDRAQVVFDMAALKHLDAAGVDVLLKCMAELMKRDGDLKLAAVSQEAAIILELTRTDRLFEIYETPSDAMRSFSRFLPGAMRQQPFSRSTAKSGMDKEPGLAA